jgi:hypothetical protein
MAASGRRERRREACGLANGPPAVLLGIPSRGVPETNLESRI